MTTNSVLLLDSQNILSDKMSNSNCSDKFFILFYLFAFNFSMVIQHTAIQKLKRVIESKERGKKKEKGESKASEQCLFL